MDTSDKDTSAKTSAGAPDEAAARPPQQGKSANARKTSRMDRLKKKIRKLQGKNPDIYPMW